jgi:hypothetical protein
MSADFASRLWQLRSLGARVIIARPQLRPVEIADAHLFVHKELAAPAPNAAAPAATEAIKTAQTLDSNKTTDAVAPAIPPASAGKDKDHFAAAPVKEAANPPSATAGAKEIDGAALRLKPAEDDSLALTSDGTGERAEDPLTGADPTPSMDTPGKAPIIESASFADDRPTITADAAAVVNITPPAKVDPPAAAPSMPSSTPMSAGAAKPGATGTPAAPQQDVTAKPAVDAALESVPTPAPKPSALAKAAPAKPIAIFISRKTKRLYVRQNFTPLFEAPVTIADPGQPFGTHVFTALSYLPDGATMRWNVMSLPGAESKVTRNEPNEKVARGKRKRETAAQPIINPPPLQAPQDALARIEIPQDVIDQISALIVPGSSLIVSDQGLGGETGEGTDFIVVTR